MDSENDNNEWALKRLRVKNYFQGASYGSQYYILLAGSGIIINFVTVLGGLILQ